MLKLLVLILAATGSAHACGACAFSSYYLPMPWLVSWMLVTAVWWLVGLRVQRRLGLDQGSLVISLAAGALAVAAGVLLLGPIPIFAYLVWKGGLYLAQLYQWRRGGLNEAELKYLRYQHMLVAALLLTALLGWAGDIRAGIEGPLSRLVHPDLAFRASSLRQLVTQYQANDEQIAQWLKDGSLLRRQNALLLAGLTHSPHLGEWIAQAKADPQMAEAIGLAEKLNTEGR